MAVIHADASLLARDALEWLLAMSRDHGSALAWTGRPDDDERPT
jgi:hypothetical protein